jgi:hypothetical protein
LFFEKGLREQRESNALNSEGRSYRLPKYKIRQEVAHCFSLFSLRNNERNPLPDVDPEVLPGKETSK